MSYYANYNGAIITKPMTTQDIQNVLFKLGIYDGNSLNNISLFSDFGDFSVDTLESNDNNATSYKINLYGHSNYNEHDIYALLEAMETFTAEGNIEYTGDGNALWRFHYRDGSWYEDKGEVTYINASKPLFIKM